jgi:Transposase, Mutator family
MLAGPRGRQGRQTTAPPNTGPYRFVQADALTLRVREGGRTVLVHGLIATGVNADGKREILGFEVTSAEDGAGWLAFFRAWSPAAWPGWCWSPPTRTPGWSRRSPPPCRAQTGKDAERTTFGWRVIGCATLMTETMASRRWRCRWCRWCRWCGWTARRRCRFGVAGSSPGGRNQTSARSSGCGDGFNWAWPANRMRCRALRTGRRWICRCVHRARDQFLRRDREGS